MKVIKRNGDVVVFDSHKIVAAVTKACMSLNYDAECSNTNGKYIASVVADLLKTFDEPPTIEFIQGLVEETLMENLQDVAKAYILYRKERANEREEKKRLLNLETLDPVSERYDLNQLRVLASRYLLRDKDGVIIETPTELFERVALLAYIPELIWDTGERMKSSGIPIDISMDDRDICIGRFTFNQYHREAFQKLYTLKAESGQPLKSYVDLVWDINSGDLGSEEDVQRFVNIMANKIFLPNSPTLMNAGARLGQLSACFVLPMKDSLKDIMKTVSDAAIIFQSGGGVGIDYTQLRPEGSVVASTSGVASGPVSFMSILDSVTEVVKQGGKRRGANMGILNANHPDIEKFISMKSKPGVMENFNVSVGIWSDFWEAVENDGNITLRHDADSETRDVRARQLLDLIAYSAWRSAEPGLVFFDNIVKSTPDKFMAIRRGPMTATNPCSEQSLYPYESCNLGSVNMAEMVDKDERGPHFKPTLPYNVRIATQFLDNIIDVNNYPITEIAGASRETRRIGLGVMGVADALYKLGIRYDSDEGLRFHDMMAMVIAEESASTSNDIGEKKGTFPLFTNGIDWKLSFPGTMADISHLRNCVTTTVAPTGSIAMIAGCSNGIEPCYSLVYEKTVAVGTFFYVNKEFANELRRRGLYSDELIQKIAKNGGSIQNMTELPEDLRDVFVTAMDLHWRSHIEVQAVWQRHIGNAISKTINMPESASVEDVKEAYLLAHKKGLKGITVYRDNSRSEQVMHAGKMEDRCSECNGRMEMSGGCSTCVECGSSSCSVN